MLNKPDLSVAAALAQFTVDLHDADGAVDQVAAAVVDFAVDTLAWPFAGLVLTRRAGRVSLAAVSDPAIASLGRLLLGPDSPLPAVARGNDPVVVDYVGDGRLIPPDEAAAAHRAGIAAVTHMPLKVGAGPVGALSLYDTDPSSSDDQRLTVAALLAQHAAVAIAQARHRESMMKAVEARKQVGQAVGILMQRFDISADLAFQVLSRHSQHSNTKLRQIAQYVVQHRRLPNHPANGE
ncbi:GAF and ANTAR domain-containing protein [Kribbella swartbergensis]